MPDKQISQLDPANALQGTELFPVTQTGLTRYTNPNAIFAFIISRINTSDVPEGSNLYFTNNRADARVNLHANRTDNPHSVTAAQLGLSNVNNLKQNLSATTDPGVGNDTTEGYSIGSEWINVSTDKIFICTDATTGSALWRDVTNISITKASIGLGNVENTALSTWAGTSNITTVGSAAVTSHTALIDHNSLLNYIASQHVDHATTFINAGTGLTGGGSLSASRTLSLDINGLTAYSGTVEGGADKLAIYDSSTTSIRSVLVNDILGVIPNMNVPIRQTTMVGAVDANGITNYFTTNFAGNQIVLSASGSVPLVYTLANGFDTFGASDYVARFTTSQTVTTTCRYGHAYAFIKRETGGSYSFLTMPISDRKERAFVASNYLLMHFDTQGTTSDYVDDYGNTVTLVGTGPTATTNPKFGTRSLDLTGAAGYLSSTLVALKSTFEVELWANVSGLAAKRTLFSYETGTGWGFALKINTSGILELYLSSNNSSWDIANALAGTTVISTGVWNHYVLSKTVDGYRVMVNGVVEIALTSTTAITTAATTLRIGSEQGGTDKFFGYIDEVRFTNGGTWYGAGIDTLPVAAYTPDLLWWDTVNFVMKQRLSGTGGWQQVNYLAFGIFSTRYYQSLLHFEANNVNGSPYNDVFKNGWTGTATLSSSAAKFGTQSAKFLASSSQYMLTTDPTLAFANKQFQIDFWVNLTTTGVVQTLFLWANAGGFGLRADVDASNHIKLYASSNGTSFDIVNGTAGSTNMATGGFVHVCVAYDGSNLKAFVGGFPNVNVATGTGIGFNGGSASLYLGRNGATQPLDGYIDEFRFRHGYVAINMTGFTPETLAYSDTDYKSADTLTPFALGDAIQIDLGVQTSKAGVNQVYTHNLGTRYYQTVYYFECLTAEFGYSIEDRVYGDMVGNSTTAYGLSIVNENQLYGSVTIGSGGIMIPNKSTGAVQTMTLANWKLVILVRRLF